MVIGSLEAGIKYFEGEIQDLKEKHITISEDDQKKIEKYKANILNNTLWITKIDDFMDGSRIIIGSADVSPTPSITPTVTPTLTVTPTVTPSVSISTSCT